MNLYEVLGVTKEADTAEIKMQYKKRAQQLHPDKETGDKEKFQRLQEAYAVLSDSGRRKQYDETGSIDEPRALRNQALEAIAHLLNLCVDSQQDLDFTDPIQLILEQIDQHERKTHQSISERTQAIDKRKRTLKRFKFEGESENLISTVLQAGIADLERVLKVLQEQLQILDLVRIILDDYTYETKGSQLMATSSTSDVNDVIAEYFARR